MIDTKYTNPFATNTDTVKTGSVAKVSTKPKRAKAAAILTADQVQSMSVEEIIALAMKQKGMN